MCWRKRHHWISLLMLVVLSRSVRADVTAPLEVLLVSPLPGAMYVLPQTHLLFRLNAPPGIPCVAIGSFIHVTGTRSGIHTGTLHACRDGLTLTFAPAAAFDWGETVKVDLHPPMVLRDSQGRLTQGFTFFVASEPGPTPVGSVEGELAGAGVQKSPDLIDGGGTPFPSRTAEGSLPPGFPPITSIVSGTTAPGLLFLASQSYTLPPAIPFLLIVDNSGAPLFYRAMADRCYDFKVLSDGRLSYYDAGEKAFILMDESYNRIGTLACGNGYIADPHELCLSPDGYAWLLAYDVQYVDMSQIVSGGNTHAAVTGLILQEVDQDGVVVFQWRSWDHFAITDATHEDLLASAIDYVHGNAIDLDEDGNPLLSCRHMDEITKIDRGTGAILWRWGGKHNTFTFLDDSVGFSHQHDLRRLANGHFTMFDNGNFHVPAHSRALEYEVDEELRTARLVWQYRNTPDIYGPAMGSVQRLENGNTLICWGLTTPTLTEVTTEGNVAFSLALGPGIISYRGYRFRWGPLLEGAPPGNPAQFAISPNYPNPFNGSTRFTVELPRDVQMTVTVFDVLGREVFSPIRDRSMSAGTTTLALDFSPYPSGVYVCRLMAGEFVAERKLILSK